MHRFLTPLLLFGAAAWVHWYNGSQGLRVVMLPGMEILFPESAGRAALQGLYTVKVLAAVGTLSLLMAIIGLIRHKPTSYDD